MSKNITAVVVLKDGSHRTWSAERDDKQSYAACQRWLRDGIEMLRWDVQHLVICFSDHVSQYTSGEVREIAGLV